MKTSYETVYFTVVDSSRKKQEWKGYEKDNNEYLGLFEFFNQGDQYYFFPGTYSYYKAAIFKDILEFITQLNNQ